MSEHAVPVRGSGQVPLVELVNRVVDRGVVLSGEITISVADIDLLLLGVRLVLSSAERLERPAEGSGAEDGPGPPRDEVP